MDDLVKKIKKSRESGRSTYPASTKHRYSRSRHKNGYREPDAGKKGRNPLIPLRFYHRSILNTTMLKELFELIVSIIVFICTVIGLFLLFIH